MLLAHTLKQTCAKLQNLQDASNLNQRRNQKISLRRREPATLKMYLFVVFTSTSVLPSSQPLTVTSSWASAPCRWAWRAAWTLSRSGASWWGRRGSGRAPGTGMQGSWRRRAPLSRERPCPLWLWGGGCAGFHTSPDRPPVTGSHGPLPWSAARPDRGIEGLFIVLFGERFKFALNIQALHSIRVICLLKFHLAVSSIFVGTAVFSNSISALQPLL